MEVEFVGHAPGDKRSSKRGQGDYYGVFGGKSFEWMGGQASIVGWVWGDGAAVLLYEGGLGR